MVSSQLSPELLSDVQTYGLGYQKKWKCEKCGYFGPQAIVKKHSHILESWPAIIIALFFGILPGLVLLANRLFLPMPRTICPQCRKLSSRGFFDFLNAF